MDKYYVLDGHPLDIRTVLMWRRVGGGHTPNINRAQLFSKEEVAEITKQNRTTVGVLDTMARAKSIPAVVWGDLTDMYPIADGTIT